MAQRAPETLTLVRHRTQPTAETIVRLTVTAVFAYLISLTVPGTSHSVLAPLTALLVAQVSLYQTVRSAISRVAAVVAGVLLAVGLAALVGFTWWSLGITIAVALAIGYALHLGDNTLEVPISAMLILSGDTKAAATGRIVDTFIGTAAGLETLEHETTTIRVLARSLADSTRLAGDDNPMNDPEARRRLAAVLRELSAAVTAYGRLATERDPSDHELLESELERHLAAAQDQQDRLADLLGSDPRAKPVGWPLRGELISHLDRLRNELRAVRPGRRSRRRRRSWRRPMQPGRSRRPTGRPRGGSPP